MLKKISKKVETYVFIRVKHSCGCLAHAYYLKDYLKKGFKFSDMVLAGIKQDIKNNHQFEEYRHLIDNESNMILKETVIPAKKSKLMKDVIKQAKEYEGKPFPKNLQEQEFQRSPFK